MPMRALLGLALVMLVAGCSDRRAPVRIGVKDFAEQAILGEVLATVLRTSGFAVGRVVECRDTWGCHKALREGHVDVLVDYTGTGLNYIDAPPGPETVERTRELYRPLGLDWRVPLGFDNGYRLLMPADEAPAGIDGLSGGSPLRFAVPLEYLRRPRDGLAALVSRYGLRATVDPLIIDPPGERYEAVRTGRADVAVGYATDGAIAEMGLRPLADPAGFFPPYEAVIVIRGAAEADHPGLGEALDRLAGRIDTAAMRALNARVQVEGRDPQAVARGFLVDAGLVDREAVTVETGPEVVLTRPDGAALAGHVPRARKALRAAFPDRPVRVEAHRAPKERLVTGGARAAILGAEQLFRWSVRRRRWVADERVEAVAVLGERRMHFVRRAGDGGEPLGGALGIERGVAGHAAKAMLDAADAGRPRADEPAALIEAVRGGDLDGALIFAAPGDPTLAAALGAGGLALRPLAGWLTAERAARLPFLRAARLPPSTYPGQGPALETVGAQVVLADAAPGDALSQGGGPAAALPGGAAPLTPDQVRRAADALGITEAPDPALPDAGHRTRAGPPPEASSWRAALEVALNGLIVLFTGWLGWLLFGARVREGA